MITAGRDAYIAYCDAVSHQIEDGNPGTVVGLFTVAGVAGTKDQPCANCRKTIFLKEIGSWMSDPKLPDSVRERWFDIWERVDPGLVNKVG
jgi:hypothetical protein